MIYDLVNPIITSIKIHMLAVKMYIRGTASWEACYASAKYIISGWKYVQK